MRLDFHTSFQSHSLCLILGKTKSITEKYKDLLYSCVAVESSYGIKSAITGKAFAKIVTLTGQTNFLVVLTATTESDLKIKKARRS